MDMTLIQVERVIATVERQFAVVLKCDQKRFLIFVGRPEATAIYRELKGEEPQRPFAHDLMKGILDGFDVRVRMIAVSSIVKNVFCATLLLRQDSGEEPRREVRLDLRASDAIVMALKCGADLYATDAVIESVEDVTELLEQADEFGGLPEGDDFGED